MEPKIMNYETEQKEFKLLLDAEGTIEATAEQQERLDEFTQRVASGEFHIETAGDIPCKCIDGRSCPNATEGPNAAGGTESIFVADDLTTKRFAAADGTVASGMSNVVEVLQGENHAVGGHSDSKNSEDLEKSGCGANDRLEDIYNMIGRKSGVIKDIAESILGEGSVNEDTEKLIVDNARERTQFSQGREVINVLQTAEEARLEELQGGHKEAVAAINLRHGTTLDRSAIEAEFGPDFQAFNVDAWSFQKAAEETSLTEEEVHQKVVAMTYYNIATALVLCGPSMRVVVVK
jgi:hypothetical protein